MKKLDSIFIFLVLLPSLVFTQAPYPMGLLIDEAEYGQLSFTSANIQLDYGRKVVHSKIDLTPYTPEVRHQGDASSCVGWSAGYAAMTIERAITNGWADRREISENANSALFVYNQISQGNCSQGISLPQALALLQEKGNCLARDFDFDINDCSKEVPEALMKKAATHKIEDYIPLFRSDADPVDKTNKVKLLLAQNKPVIVGMQVLQNFYGIKAGTSSWWPSIGNTRRAGGHAMVVVGYDDTKFHVPNRQTPKNMQGAFQLMNSWGKNWGEEGFIWIRYAHFAQYCRQAFAIMLADGAPISLDDTPSSPVSSVGRETNSNELTQQEMPTGELVQLSGDFGFKHYLDWDQGPVFQEARVNLEYGHYTLEGNWRVGDQFQLYIKSGFDKGYIYVFSIDQVGKAEVHFPKSEKYNVKFEGQNESALILNGGSLLTIPSEDSVLKLAQAGTDHLVALFSTQKIKPRYIELLSSELSKHKQDLPGKLLEVLQKHMVPVSDIRYYKNTMGFEVSSRSAGKIVPVILSVEVKE